MAQSSLTPVHSSGLLERDYGNPFLRLHRELNPRALLGSVEATFEQDARPGPSDEIADAVRRVAALRSREHDVLQGLLAGHSNKLIASDLGISVRTVEVHRARMMKRLGVHQLAEAVRLGILSKRRPAAAHPLQQESPVNIDVRETDEELRICAYLPGLNENDIDVFVDDDVLTIRAGKKNEKESRDFVERSCRFLGSLRLPYSVESDKIRANLDNGVITVTLPKCGDKERR
jgi:HSP20 family molecular chaperone IbpA